MRAQPEFVVVGSYPDAVQAHIARGQLESAGIAARLADEHMVSTDWLLSHALHGVKLLAPAARAEEAMALLAAPPLHDEALACDDDDRCPACGSLEIEELRQGWKLALLSVHILQLPLPFRRGRYLCKACQQTFSY